MEINRLKVPMCETGPWQIMHMIKATGASVMKGEQERGQGSWPENDSEISFHLSLQRGRGVGHPKRWGGHFRERKMWEPRHRDTRCLAGLKIQPVAMPGG